MKREEEIEILMESLLNTIARLSDNPWNNNKKSVGVSSQILHHSAKLQILMDEWQKIKKD